MKKRLASLAAIVVVSALSAAIAAQPSNGSTSAAPERGISPEQRARLAQKIARVDRIVQAVAGRATAANLQWLRERLYSMPLEQLEALGLPASFEQASEALGRASVATKALGSLNFDLVYVPFAPCRYIDTRNAGGKINGTRTYDTASNGSIHGGSAACDPRTLAGVASEDDIGAYALNLTILDTSVAGSPGFARMQPAGATQNVALVNWTVSSAGFQLGNAAVITADQSGATDELAIFTTGSVHAVVDLAGAFVRPATTKLECYRQATVVNVPAGGFASGLAVCASTYQFTGGNCNKVDATVQEANSAVQPSTNEMYCEFVNTSGVSRTAFANAVCCRVPGR